MNSTPPDRTRGGRSITWYPLLVYFFVMPWSDLVGWQSPPTRWIGYVIVAGLLVDVGRNRGLHLANFHRWLLLFAAWTLTSMLWSPDRALAVTLAVAQVKGVVLAVAAWQVSREPRDFRLLAVALVLGSAAAMLLSLSDYYQGQARVIERGFGEVRFKGGTFSPNNFAVFTAACIPLAISLARRSRSRLMLLAWSAFIPLSWYCILLSASRTGLACATLATGAMLLSMKQSVRTIGIGLAALLLAALAADRFWIPNSAFERLNEADRGFAGRMEIWAAGVPAFIRNPVAGVGIGGYNDAVYDQFLYGYAAHNTLLQIATELGLVGLALFLLMLAQPVRESLRAWSRGETEWLAMGLTLALGTMALSNHLHQMIWASLALILGACRPLPVALRSPVMVKSLRP